MTTYEHQVLETAITTIHQTTGIGAHVLPEIAGQDSAGEDAIIEVETDGHKYRFAAEVQTVDRFETPAIADTVTCERGPKWPSVRILDSSRIHRLTDSKDDARKAVGRFVEKGTPQRTLYCVRLKRLEGLCHNAELDAIPMA